MRVDHSTTSEAAAGRYEAIHNGEALDQPSRSDCDESLHVTMHRQYRKDAEDRAKGAYVPSFWTRSTFGHLNRLLDKVPATATITRDGVFAVTPQNREQAQQVADHITGSDLDCDVVVADGIVWVRSEDSRHDTPPY